MTDRIEALARQIDPEAWESVELGPVTDVSHYPVEMQEPHWFFRLLGRKAFDKNKRDRRLSFIMGEHQRLSEWRKESNDKSIRRDKARDVARIALGVSLVLGDRLTQHDDGK